MDGQPVSEGAAADVDTRVLRYFLAVAEQLSFTAAARELYVTQPSLSRQIRRLEADLGADLFARTGREVRLTAAGEALVPAARRLTADWARAVREVRTTAAAERNVLRLGFVATGAGPLGLRVRAAFAARRPEAVLELTRFDWGGEAEGLRRGLADVAFLWLPADLTGLHARTVATERRWVALPRRHPLADRPDVGIADLGGERLMWTRRAPREWVDWWAVNPRPDGSEPLWGPENDNVEEMLEHVAAGGAVCLAAESMATYYTHPELVWRPVRDIEPLRIAVAWPRERTSPPVADFLAAVRECVRDPEAYA
ncbi:LysR substrate-binding domain-containing protein [Streptomyces sp. WMMC500]|uniref:LysR family transcriptional regulator n=1 Tax=Streptomyces sp. WMMC500 TaxID=3015154 RepID=UPI00248BAA58|nr:LysR substrate-binding domain-containing protein [Streptomyces sp. WMMC500]WBB63145.1 LysR substrate-binding domain-containing protein [Streptomyces sp. WMMC500]